MQPPGLGFGRFIAAMALGALEKRMVKLMLCVVSGLVAGAILSGNRALAQPAGSYQESCTRIRQRGPMLFALCRNVQGGWTHTSINAGSCRGPIANTNGLLTCDGAVGRSYGPTPRSYDRDDEDRDRRDYRTDRDRRDWRYRDRRVYGDARRGYYDDDSQRYGRPPY